MRVNEKLTPRAKDQVLGCMVGGAVGDALGYAVEFASYDSIVKKYGAKNNSLRFKSVYSRRQHRDQHQSFQSYRRRRGLDERDR